MPVPKYRTSKSKRDKRRSHHGLSERYFAFCPNCGEVKRSHHICDNCGYYKGRKVMEPRASSLTSGINSTFDTGN